MDLKGFTTKIIHTEFNKDDVHNTLQMPIYSNAAFGFGTAEEMEQAFQGRLPSHIYSRISNPTVENFEQRVRSVTGALAVTAVSSGMAAIANTILTIAEAGKNIITSRYLFGNTYSLFSSTLKPYGIEPRFCDLLNKEDIERHIDKDTFAIFFETITNPQLSVADIALLANISRKYNLVLIADSTLTPPNIFPASKFGVHFEVISSTKIISGGATSIGGLIVDYGTYNWDNNTKLSDLAKKFGPFAFNVKLRKEIHRNLGACLSPYHAYLQSLGLESLDLRYEKAGENCLKLAEFLQQQPQVKWVNYPGLTNSTFYKVANEQYGKYPCAILTFELESRNACFTFLNKLQLISRATNLYDNRTLIVHPASTIYCDYTPEVRQSLGVSDSLIRLSVGIEDISDLQNDIYSALN
jgi:O-acetylhomoserine (thiol)-lyase